MIEGARAVAMPEPMIGYRSVLCPAVRASYAADLTSDVEKVTGGKPITFRSLAHRSTESSK